MSINNQGTIQDKESRERYKKAYDNIKWSYQCSKCKQIVKGTHKDCTTVGQE